MNDWEKVSKEELEAFWRGDKETYLRLYSERMRRRATLAELSGKKVTYIPNDGSETLPEVTITPPKETKELKQVRLKQDYENFTDNAISVAGFIPGLDVFADVADIGNSLRQGDVQAALWGVAGIGLPGSGKMWKTLYNKARSPLKTYYQDIYPEIYKSARSLKGLKSDISAFFRGLSSNPVRTVLRNRLLRKRWNHPKIDIEEVELGSWDGKPNYQGDPIELMKERYKDWETQQNIWEYNRPMASRDPFHEDHFLRYEDIEHKDYVPLKDIYKAIGPEVESPLYRTLTTIKLHRMINKEPGLMFTPKGTKMLYINTHLLKKLFPNVNVNVVKGHEIDHALNRVENVVPYPKHIFDYSHLPSGNRRYLSNITELNARGSLIKNYFGLTGPYITPNMLKYAAKHYVEDVGIDNNMLLFFSGIKDWDAAADWLSKHSLRKGGKL